MHFIIDTSTIIKSLSTSEARHEETRKFLEDIDNNEKSTVWIPTYVVSETTSRILSNPQFRDKHGKIGQIWPLLTASYIKNEFVIENILDLKRIFKNAYKITKSHSKNKNAPNFIDCYQVELANYFSKNTRDEISIASFDQFFPKGNYTPVFS